MSEVRRDMGASAELDLVGPDYFSFYTQEVAELLSHDGDFLPLPSETAEFGERTSDMVGDKAIVLGSLFSSPIGARLSEYKKERLKALLRQSAVTLSQEVDEMLDPVFAICRLQSQLRYAKCLPNCSGPASGDDAKQHPHKKIKLSSSTSFASNGSPVSAEVCYLIPSFFLKRGFYFSVSWWRVLLRHRCSDPPASIGVAMHMSKVNEDLQFLLENSTKVEESMKKHSDEQSETLGHMERQLEEILDRILSTCRLMTLSEKQQLQKLIQKLPPRNLDRVVEIIQRNKPSGKYSSGTIHVDLEKEASRKSALFVLLNQACKFSVLASRQKEHDFEVLHKPLKVKYDPVSFCTIKASS
ncbi:hypothetical protein RHMOL_Rhmol10G0020000 [Rhododendron molle]|uniref:Uncharacterized protein n=1 Tax=Rhododendron molle TaxID=49168 RepID=A0ACC0LZ48_RHOML|nr:hypothetical protein RHMOL_Rhmol10G0020000 [Rhododendron molle]